MAKMGHGMAQTGCEVSKIISELKQGSEERGTRGHLLKIFLVNFKSK